MPKRVTKEIDLQMELFKGFNQKKFSELMIFTVSIVVLAIAGYYFSGLITIFMFMDIILLTILGIRSNAKILILCSVISSVIVLMITGEVLFAINLLISVTIPGLAASYGFKKKWHFRELFLLIASAYLFSLLAVINIGTYIEGVNQVHKLIIDPAREIFTSFYHDFKDKILILENSGIDTGRLDLIKRYINVNDLMYMFKLIIPGIMIISSAFWGYITLMSIKAILKRRGYSMENLPEFHEMRVSRGTILIFITTFILLLFVKHLKVYAALVNINVILYFVFLVVGFSVVDFFFRKTRIPGIIRIIIYIPVFLILLLVGLILPFLHPFSVLIIIAVADSTFDLRKLRSGEEGKNDGK